MSNEKDCNRIPCGEGEIVLGDPAPSIPTFTFGPAPTVDCLDDNAKTDSREHAEFILGAPCPPLNKIYFFEKEKNGNTST